MKGKLLFVCAVSLLLSAIPANAQFHAAAKVGLTDNKVVPGESGDGSKVGFLIGAYGEYDFIDWFGLRAGLQFTQKGTGNKAATVTKNIQCFDSIESMTLNYLEVPFNLVFKTLIPAGEQNIIVGFGGGLYGGFLYGGNASIRFTEQYEGGLLKHNVKNVAKIGLADGSGTGIQLDRFNTFDAGLDINLEFAYNSFCFNVGYQRGFVDLSVDAPYIKSNACRTSTLYFAFGYYFL